MNKKIVMSALSLAVASVIGQAAAKDMDSSGDIMMDMSNKLVLRASAAYLTSFSKDPKLTVTFNPTSAPADAPVTAPDPKYNMKNKLSAAISASYFLNSQFAIQLSATLPTEIKQSLKSSGTIPAGVVIGQVDKLKYQQTALMGQFYMSSPDAPVMGYIGVGAAYNYLKGTVSTTGAASGVTGLKIKNIVSPIVQAGFDYYFDDNMFLNASLSYTTMKVTETSTVPNTASTAVQVTATNKYTFAPVVASVGVGVRF